MRTIKFYSLGCKVNQYDTQSIRERFLQKGYQEAGDGFPADVYLVDTCTVTSCADSKSRSVIRQCVKENPAAVVIVTGCMAEKDAGVIAKIKGVSFIIGKRFFPEGVSRFCGRTRAFLKIQDGCDNFCSYCKVPLVRGRPRSRDLKEVLLEAEALVKNGFKEIVLTGICLGAYGKDSGCSGDLLDLISELEKIEALSRIRLSSIEPKDVSHELIHKFVNSKRLCRHLHIPLQSGDDQILRRMNRNYTRKHFLNLIKHIKKNIPDVSITTDVLIGFPGEKERNFQNTIEVVKEILPLKVHIFPYSPREGTLALKLTDKAAQAEVRERLMRMKDASRDLSYAYRSQFMGRTLGVLFEERIAGKDHPWSGFSSNYIKVRLNSQENLKNKLVLLKINKIMPDFALATP